MPWFSMSLLLTLQVSASIESSPESIQRPAAAATTSAKRRRTNESNPLPWKLISGSMPPFYFQKPSQQTLELVIGRLPRSLGGKGKVLPAKWCNDGKWCFESIEDPNDKVDSKFQGAGNINVFKFFYTFSCHLNCPLNGLLDAKEIGEDRIVFQWDTPQPALQE